MRCVPVLRSFVFTSLIVSAVSGNGQELAPGVRGVATRAPDKVVLDGDLSEYRHAFCTPINYFHPDPRNRAAQFYYMWDDEAFHAGLRTLDRKRANQSLNEAQGNGERNPEAT